MHPKRVVRSSRPQTLPVRGKDVLPDDQVLGSDVLHTKPRARPPSQQQAAAGQPKRSVSGSMTTQRRELYASPNGDVWYLCRERSGQIVVSHEPSLSSGGKSSQVDLGTFLAPGNNGPEHQALLHLIGELVDPTWLPSIAEREPS
jgi:hypothetical protein